MIIWKAQGVIQQTTAAQRERSNHYEQKLHNCEL